MPSVPLTLPSPITVLGIKATGSPDIVAAVGQPTPIRVPRIGRVLVQLTPVPPPAVQASAPIVVYQATSGGRAFAMTGKPDAMQRLQIWEGQDVPIQGRPIAPDHSTVLFQTDIFAATFLLFDDSQADKHIPVHQEELVVSEVMRTSLIDDATWKVDATGYTFSHTVPGSLLREGGRVYRAEYVLKSEAHGPAVIVQEIETSGLRTPRSYLGS